MSKAKKNNIRIEIKDDGKPHRSFFSALHELSYLPDLHEQTSKISEWVNDHSPLVGDGDEAHGQATTKAKKQKTKEKTFRDIVSGQKVSDPDELLEKLHDLIDGKRGKDVGLVLLRAYAIDEYLTEKPTKAVVLGEFTINGSWSGVHKFMNENDKYSMKVAKRIKIL